MLTNYRSQMLIGTIYLADGHYVAVCSAQSIIGRQPCKLVVSLYQRHHATKYSEHSTKLRFDFISSCVDLHFYQ